jgi:hypothetical protein
MTKQIKHVYDSLEDFIRSNDNWKTRRHGGECSHNTTDPKFYGSSSYEQGLAVAATGWRDGATRVAELRAELSGAVQAMAAARASQMTYDVVGECFDIGKIATGEPEFCMNWDDQGNERSQKVVKIVANISVSAAVNKETIYARGAACLAAVDLLETLGQRVELWIAIGVNGSSQFDKREYTQLDTQVCVKSAGQPVETDRLAFVLCHASMFRRIGFAHFELNGFHAGMSYPAAVLGSHGVVMLPELRTGSTPSKRDTINQVLDICKRAGVTFEASDLELITHG